MTRTEAGPKAVEAYIAAFPEDVQELLQSIRELIREEAPGAEETISYGIPTFKLNGNLVHYAAYKKHIGFYPAASGIAHFQDRFGAYRSSKGAVQFPLDREIPYDLIREIVRFRVQENLGKSKA